MATRTSVGLRAALAPHRFRYLERILRKSERADRVEAAFALALRPHLRLGDRASAGWHAAWLLRDGMPASGAALTQPQVDLIQAWIAAGALNN